MKVSEYSLWEDIWVEIRRGFLSIKKLAKKLRK